MGIASTGDGLLPGYASIGVWAPILLLVLRTVQGFRARRRVGRRQCALDRGRTRWSVAGFLPRL